MNKPMDGSVLPWRGKKGGASPSWLPEHGPPHIVAVVAARSQQGSMMLQHMWL